MYSEFLELIEKYGDLHNLNLTTFDDEDIFKEESRFGKLPPTYKAFLRHCPTGSFFQDSFILYEGLLSFEDLSPACCVLLEGVLNLVQVGVCLGMSLLHGQHRLEAFQGL